MNEKVLIIGCGVVGGNLKRDLSKLNPEVYDKYKGIDTRTHGEYDVAFVCVDTPKSGSSLCDTSEVENAIRDNSADIYVIKSTIIPGTTKRIALATQKNVLFSPEYYGGTQHCNNFNFDFTILGGDRRSACKVIQTLQGVYDARHKFRITDSTTAEIVKYMENCWLATKVSFCNQFAEICEAEGVEYEEVRELFLLDERVNPAHTFVYKDKPYWQSHCLDKDVPAIAEHENAEFLKSVIMYNESRKQRKIGKKE